MGSRWLRLAGLAMGLAHGVSAGAECGTGICNGNPCTITGTHTIANNCVLDFGTKSVTVAPGAQLKTSGVCNIGPDDDCPVFTIRAGTLTHKGLLQALGGTLTIEVLGDFATQDAGGQHGVINVGDTAAGDGGGALDLRATGAVTIATTVTTDGGGSLVVSGCSVTLSGTLNATDGDVEVDYRQGFTASTGGVISSTDNTISCRDADENLICDSAPQGLVCTRDAANNDHCAGGSGVVVSPVADLSEDALGPCTGCGNAVKESGEACDDGNVDPCDGCSAGCQATPNGSPCDDGDACTASDVCHCTESDCSDSGNCVGQPIACDDGNACTTNACDPAVGCVFGPVNCNDGNPCTTDVCVPASGCVHGTTNCDDGNACTTDSCDPARGCVHGATACNDGIACTIDACDPVRGCIITGVNHAPCNDGLACNADFCLPGQGCVHYAYATCDDGNKCTTNDMCADAECPCPAGKCHGTPISCDDGNPCTADSCDPAIGCAHTPLTGPACNDGNACTGDDHCEAGACTGTSMDGPCDDGNACTIDTCHAGRCVAKALVDCDDGNPCTVDSCQAQTICEDCDGCSGQCYDAGCHHAPATCQYDLEHVIPNPDAAGTSDGFGAALAAVGSSLIVGAPGTSVAGLTGAGTVYVFDATTGGLARTIASPSPVAGETFGRTLAASGATVLVSGNTNTPASPGTVYVFNPQTATLVRTLGSATPAPGDSFGAALGAAGSNAVVGAPGQLKAFLFDGATGALLRTLYQSAGGFGSAVAAWNDRVVVGAPQTRVGTYPDVGAVYLFEASSGILLSVRQAQTIYDLPPLAGTPRFGAAAAGNANGILAGAPGEHLVWYDGTSHVNWGVGAAYSAAGKAPARTTVSPLVFPYPYGTGYGSCIGGAGQNFVVGAPGGVNVEGAAYLVAGDGPDGRVVWTFKSPVPGRQFGCAATEVDGRIAIGPGTWNGPQSVYLYGHRCGNGVLDPGEQCDDGNTRDGDCCSSQCKFEPSGTSCDDAKACTAPGTCTGAGVCTAGPCLCGCC